MIRSLFVGIYNANKLLCKQQLLYASNFIQDENSKMKYWENTANKYIKESKEETTDSNPNYESLYRLSFANFAKSSSYDGIDGKGRENKPAYMLENSRDANNMVSNVEETSSKLSHLDDEGSANMVDVGSKNVTKRMARAVAIVNVGETAYTLVAKNQISKGNVLTVAQVAGILAAKRTSELIPLCHPVQINKIDVKCQLLEKGSNKIRVESVVRCEGKTGVEMEALTGVSLAALTIYDMCKAVNKSIVIESIRLEEKTGGKSDYLNSPNSKEN